MVGVYCNIEGQDQNGFSQNYGGRCLSAKSRHYARRRVASEWNENVISWWFLQSGPGVFLWCGEEVKD